MTSNKQTETDKFRALKVGNTISVDVKNYSHPYGTAKQAGIKVKTKVTKPKETADGLMTIEVTRIPNRKRTK